MTRAPCYRIECHRSAASRFGERTSWLKAGGRVLTWRDRGEALAELERVRARMAATPNVSYVLREIP